MKPEIRDKLDTIEDLFPDEQLEKSKARWRRLYQGGERPDR